MPIHRFDQQLSGKRYPCVQFVTRANPVFSEWHHRFYGASDSPATSLATSPRSHWPCG